MNDNPWNSAAAPSKLHRRVNRNSFLAKIALGGAFAAFLGIVALAVFSLLIDSQAPKKRVVQISLLVPPPPPPPPPQVKPPTPTVKPPELVVKEPVKLPEPDPPKRHEEPPVPNQPTRADIKGSGSGDATDLAASGEPGGLSIGGGGGDRARFGWFASAIETQLKEHLNKNEKLRVSGYRITMRLWVNRDGWIERYELIGSAGNPELDRSLLEALQGMPRLEKRPPAEMPQPVTLRITARAVSG
jgi:periplasmic protein TonB